MALAGESFIWFHNKIKTDIVRFIKTIDPEAYIKNQKERHENCDISIEEYLTVIEILNLLFSPLEIIWLF